MEFLSAKVKGVKADVVSGRITLTFSVPMTDLYDAQQLAGFAEADMGKVELVVRSKQMVMADLFTETLKDVKGEWQAAEQPPSGSPRIDEGQVNSGGE